MAVVFMQRISPRLLRTLRGCTLKNHFSQLRNKGPQLVCLETHGGVRSLYVGCVFRFPERTNQYYSNQFNQRPRQHEEEYDKKYDNDESDLEKLRQEHREQARAQHKAKEGITFADFSINPTLLRRLDKLGYKEPFEIQSETLRHTLDGRDVIAKAVTGSGKTLCFGIPIVSKIADKPRNERSRNPRAIVISPTRELCLQIHRCIEELDPKVKCVAVYGGERYANQERRIMRGCDVICATPGRLNDHLQRGLFGLEEVEFLCLDEADELLRPNFMDQIQDLLEGCPDERQIMMFSATMPGHIRSLTGTYMREPEVVDITQNANYSGSLAVKHKCMECSPRDIVPVLITLLKDHNPNRCIVFMETKRLTEDVTFDLRRCGAKAEYINSDKSQDSRERILKAFRRGGIRILVATDVASRGLDIPEIDLIIQVMPPKNGTDSYVHRSGRTGRAGREGLAIMLHTGADMQIISEIEEMVNLEHVPPPDAGHLRNINFRTIIGQRSSGGFGGGYSRYDSHRAFGGRSRDERDFFF